jgi:hypothetical protein
MTWKKDNSDGYDVITCNEKRGSSDAKQNKAFYKWIVIGSQDTVAWVHEGGARSNE